MKPKTKKWEGKSRGTVLGYRIFAFFIRKLGLYPAYFLLIFVVAYYCVTTGAHTRLTYCYFRRRHGWPRWRSIISVYRNYYVFGQTLIDKMAVASGLQHKFTYQHDGIETLREVQLGQKGGLFISAHVGNFEMAQYFLNDTGVNATINLLTTDTEHRSIKAYMEHFSLKSAVKFIILKDDMSHIFEIHAALAKNEFVCMTGDRYAEGAKRLKARFLGADAWFPAGPFVLGSRLKVPVLFLYVMKHCTRRYALFCRQADVKQRDPEGLLGQYAENVAWILEKYPLQWFNYFDFWEA